MTGLDSGTKAKKGERDLFMALLTVAACAYKTSRQNHQCHQCAGVWYPSKEQEQSENILE
jgi:hypothetical protein